ncbi:hypothetical protein HHI36_012687 [Cryptolaemus montrouzieri]|uniref:Uncharacterized protein n=1 Tax=Cryptolaemus montrouzieri TaxID=559131 RepID=A0ABD2NF44_9CUCU
MGGSSSKEEEIIIAQAENSGGITDKESSTILNDRLNNLGHNAEVENPVNMNDSFDLKTASALLPSIVSGDENSIRQLIDAIELYDECLNADGKKFLTTYFLKTRLSQKAKLRLDRSYASKADLVKDMRSKLLTKHSATALSVELHKAKQNRKSVNEFGRMTEELMVDLTISQSEVDADAAKILTATNEKIAINSFTNGLRDTELRTIIISRYCSKLSDAIVAAQDGANTKRLVAPPQAFYTRGNFRNQHGRGRFNQNLNNLNSRRPFNEGSYQRNYNNQSNNRRHSF